MERMIPGKTKVQIEFFKGVTLGDALIGVVAFLAFVFVAISSLPGKLYILIGLVFLAALLLLRVDSQPNYIFLLHLLRHFAYHRRYRRQVRDEMLLDPEAARADAFQKVFDKKGKKARKAAKGKAAQAMAQGWEASGNVQDVADIIAFTGIQDNLILYGDQYFGAVLEIPPVEFRFFSEFRRGNSIENALGRTLRSLGADGCANIVKIDRPVQYDAYLEREHEKLEQLRAAYEKGMLNEQEFQARVEVMYDRINAVEDLCYGEKIIEPFYYVVLFDRDKRQLENQISTALGVLRGGELHPRRLNTKELAVFLKYTNCLDFDERDIEKLDPADYTQWAMPQSVTVKGRSVEVGGVISHTFRIVGYPALVGDAWLAGVFSMPGTKCVIKCRSMDREKSIRTIDRSLQELRGQYMNTGVDSKRMELETHIETLGGLLATLQQNNESLLEVNVYVTAYDLAATQADPILDSLENSSLPNIPNMRRVIRRTYQEAGLRLNNMEFDQMFGFIGSQISALDPLASKGRGIPSNTLAAAYPWIYASVSDVGGILLGQNQGVPVFIDFFRRDSERINSNMVIVGKSGSGKSYATKSLLTNLAAEDAKIFVLDPENEYTELAANLHGKFINVGNAQHGRLNPFHIITALEDDEAEGGISGSYATHLQFLEEFFRQILPDCDRDALEYLNSLVDRVYLNKGITPETDLSALTSTDYPTFDDLYDAVLSEFQQSDSEYIKGHLRVLMNHVAKFAAGGRNANIWNGPSTVTTDENFTVFNFQSLLANRNNTVANAQMLLVLKYLDNEIIKNREYNLKYGLNRKIVVAIDEAHVFIDSKFPVALDFMFQLAKRIRKYNGMQIVITQNIKDFVGSEEIARKSTAIINACQYSFVFSLAPNDMDDLCKLYEKAGGINEHEREQILSAPRGQAFTIMSPMSRSTFRIQVPKDTVAMFRDPNYQSGYFLGTQGQENWEQFLGQSRQLHLQNRAVRSVEKAERKVLAHRQHVSFEELDEEQYRQRLEALRAENARKEADIRQAQLREEKSLVEQVLTHTPEAVTLLEEVEEPAPKTVIFEETVEEPTAGAVTFEETVEEPAAQDPWEIPEPAPTAAPAAKPLPASQAAHIIPAQPQSPLAEQTLEKLADALGQFRFDMVRSEIQRSVREELEKAQLGTFAQAPAAPAQEAPAQEVPAPGQGMVANQDGTASFRIETAKIPAPDQAQDIQFQDFAIAEEGEEQPGGEAQEEDGFDIMALLAEQAKKMESISPIEMMEIYEETVIEVTLEDLDLYVRKLYQSK